MAYTVYSGDAAEKLLTDIKKALRQIKELKGKKNSQAEIAKLRQEITRDSEALEKIINKDIAGCRANFIEHAQKVDIWLGQCVGFLKTGAKALEDFKKFGRTLDRDAALGAQGIIDATLKLAQADAKDYGISWKYYRAANFTSGGVEGKYITHFNTEVGKLVAGQKPVNVKIDKMESLVDQAAALKKLTQKAASQTLRDMSEAREEAEQLATKIGSMFTAFKNSDKGSMNSVTGNYSTISKAAKNTQINQKAALKNYEGLYTNALNSVKAWRVAYKGMENVLATTKKGFNKLELADADVKKKLMEADKIMSEARYVIKMGEVGLQQASKDLAVLRKRLVK